LLHCPLNRHGIQEVSKAEIGNPADSQKVFDGVPIIAWPY
jgi:hypothetical protein